MSFIKKNYQYFLFFFFTVFVVFILLYLDNTYDAVWEYGMSHAIRIGEMPYKDFNTVSTPFFIMLSSVGLWIYDSFAVYLLEFCLLYTFAYYFLYKILGKKSIWIVLAMCVFLFHSFIATYNAMAFVLMIFLMYLEKNKKSDFWIGFVMGLLILSKHTIGLPVFFITCLGVRNWKKIFERVKGMLLPLGCFLLILLLTKSFLPFLDLCLFGLFDFGTNNRLLINWCVVLTFIMFVITVYHIWKHSKNILFYYALGAFFFVFPICDIGHIPHLLPLFLIPIIDLYQEKMNLKILPIALIVILLLINIFLRWDLLQEMRLSPYNHFTGTMTYAPSISSIDQVLHKVSSYDRSIIIDGTGMFFNIVLDHKIDYFGVPLHGNYGYHGTSKMIERISKMKDTYFFIDYHNYYLIKNGLNKDDSQFDVDIVEYVIDHSEEVGKVGIFTIYHFA